MFRHAVFSIVKALLDDQAAGWVTEWCRRAVLTWVQIQQV
jgi:hypothetical protein